MASSQCPSQELLSTNGSSLHIPEERLLTGLLGFGQDILAVGGYFWPPCAHRHVAGESIQQYCFTFDCAKDQKSRPCVVADRHLVCKKHWQWLVGMPGEAFISSNLPTPGWKTLLVGRWPPSEELTMVLLERASASDCRQPGICRVQRNFASHRRAKGMLYCKKHTILLNRPLQGRQCGELAKARFSLQTADLCCSILPITVPAQVEQNPVLIVRHLHYSFDKLLSKPDPHLFAVRRVVRAAASAEQTGQNPKRCRLIDVAS